MTPTVPLTHLSSLHTHKHTHPGTLRVPAGPADKVLETLRHCLVPAARTPEPDGKQPMEGTHSQPLLSPQFTSEVHGEAQMVPLLHSKLLSTAQTSGTQQDSRSGRTLPSSEHLWAGKNSGRLLICPGVCTGTRYPQKVSPRTQAVSHHTPCHRDCVLPLCCHVLACLCCGPQISLQCLLKFRFLPMLVTLEEALLT